MKRVRPFLARMPARPHPVRLAVVGSAVEAAAAAPGLEELRLFATAWLCGVVFFGNLLA